MTGKEKCRRLKAIRKVLADKLGVDIHQVECTFEGECRGTCPKCKQEERDLNAAILRRGAAVAGAAAIATSLAACVPNIPGTHDTGGGQGTNEPLNDDRLSGAIAPDPDDQQGGDTDPGDIVELSGDVAYIDEDAAETSDAAAEVTDAASAKDDGTDCTCEKPSCACNAPDEDKDDTKVVEIEDDDLSGYVPAD